jgi:hypothetical protein
MAKKRSRAKAVVAALAARFPKLADNENIFPLAALCFVGIGVVFWAAVVLAFVG